MLQVWDGTHDLEVVTDATYTVNGIDLHNRHKHLHGINCDIWQLIYQELDQTTTNAAGHLDIIKLKSHSDAGHLVGKLR